MTREEILAGFESLARSQGSYGRLLRDLRELEEDEPEVYEKFFEQFIGCKDMLDVILTLECGM